MSNESTIPEKPKGVSAEDLAVYVMDELSDQLKAIIDEHKDVGELIKKFVLRLIRSSKNQKSGIIDPKIYIEEQKQKNTQWLENLGFDVNQLFSVWENNAAFQEIYNERYNKSTTFFSSTLIMANILLMYIGNKLIQVPDLYTQIYSAIATCNVATGFALTLNRLQNSKDSFQKFFERNVRSIERLANIDPTAPKKLQDNYGITNFSRYPIAQLIAQLEGAPKTQKKNVLCITTKFDTNFALNGFQLKGGNIMSFKSTDYLKALRNGYGVTIAEVGSVLELETLIQKLALEDQLFDHVVINAHGGAYGIILGPQEYLTVNSEYQDQVLRKLNDILKVDATILVVACSSAKKADGIVAHIAKITKKRTMGAETDTRIKLQFKNKSLHLLPYKGTVNSYSPEL
ncbi:MAG: hypothetical protein WAU07_04730 [Microgenomates group bacterium]